MCDSKGRKAREHRCTAVCVCVIVCEAAYTVVSLVAALCDTVTRKRKQARQHSGDQNAALPSSQKMVEVADPA